VSPSLRLRRQPEPERAAPAAPAPEVEAEAGQSTPRRTSGKGRPTPKRREAEAGRRRGVVDPPPADKKEARERRRERTRAAREGMARGDVRYLPRRDQGPVRALVRDLVDTRRNASSLFLPSALLVVVGGLFPQPAVIQVTYLLWVAVLVTIVVDSVLLSRLVLKRVRAEFPASTERGSGLAFYAIMRAMQLRRLRVPQPRVRVGQKV
jgi:hypothetical protein